MYKIKFTMITILCAFIILGAGYFGIKESGSRILESGRTLEESVYENTSSNIFYGKIEEDVELFPWNYYPEENAGEIEADIPLFLEEGMFEGEDVSDQEAEYNRNRYFVQMIAYESNVDEDEVWDSCYAKNAKGIVGSMVMVESPMDGSLYFYQDTLILDGKKYQVRIACSDWNILSFTCVEDGHGKDGNLKSWEEGKERLVEILESSENEMEEYFAYMIGLQELSLSMDEYYMYGGEKAVANMQHLPLYYILYTDDETKYINAQLQSLFWLDDMMLQTETKTEEENLETIQLIKAYGKGYGAEDIADYGIYDEEAIGETEEDVDYEMEENSYQIVELKDMILLLMQGETTTLGIYYDPMNRKFCGYHYFYE